MLNFNRRKRIEGNIGVLLFEAFIYLVILNFVFSFILFGTAFIGFFLFGLPIIIIIMILLLALFHFKNQVYLLDDRVETKRGKSYHPKDLDKILVSGFMGFYDIFVKLNGKTVLLLNKISRLDKDKILQLYRKHNAKLKIEHKKSKTSFIFLGFLIFIILIFGIFYFFFFNQKDVSFNYNQIKIEDREPSSKQDITKNNYGNWTLYLDRNFVQLEQEDYTYLKDRNSDYTIILSEGLAKEIQTNTSFTIFKYIPTMSNPFDFFKALYTDKIGIIAKMFQNIILDDLTDISILEFRKNNKKGFIIIGKKKNNDQYLTRIQLFTNNNQNSIEINVLSEEMKLSRITKLVNNIKLKESI